MSFPRAINDAHPSAPDFFQDLIVADAPIAIVHIDLVEYRLKCSSGFSLAAEGAVEHAIQAKPTSHTRCRPTLFTRCDTALNPQRIGDIAGAHRSITRHPAATAAQR